MASVELAQLEQVEYLISQSANGNHILFDTDLIKEVFRYDLSTAIPQDHVEEIKQFLAELVNQPSIKAKRAYFESLPEEVQHLLVRTYFSILENSICKSKNHVA